MKVRVQLKLSNDISDPQVILSCNRSENISIKKQNKKREESNP